MRTIAAVSELQECIETDVPRGCTILSASSSIGCAPRFSVAMHGTHHALQPEACLYVVTARPRFGLGVLIMSCECRCHP